MVLIDPAVFENIQQKIDEDTAFHEELRDITQQLQKQIRSAQAQLSHLHSSSTTTQDVIQKASVPISDAITTISTLATKANTQPYYKWNHVYNRTLESACFTILLSHWVSTEQLLSLEQLGNVLNVPVNVKDRDTFHLTIEEYLLSLITLIDELARLARNAVTSGDFRKPVVIAQFVKDVHAGFQILNLKNDILRKRSDGIKYRLKEVEDVVYDLSLRKLLPNEQDATITNPEGAE